MENRWWCYRSHQAGGELAEAKIEKGEDAYFKGVLAILTERRGCIESRKVCTPLEFVLTPKPSLLPAKVFGPQRRAGTKVFLPKMLLDEAIAVLSKEADFAAQQNWIAETMAKHGNRTLFGVKYHPELAYVEYFWRATAKSILATSLRLFMGGVEKRSAECVAFSAYLYTIRRHADHVFRYLQGLRRKAFGGAGRMGDAKVHVPQAREEHRCCQSECFISHCRLHERDAGFSWSKTIKKNNNI